METPLPATYKPLTRLHLLKDPFSHLVPPGTMLSMHEPVGDKSHPNHSSEEGHMLRGAQKWLTKAIPLPCCPNGALELK